ncbi:hypothetical protein [uncultured Rikenella sp.]|nr:hypothetical protein [uncultured Rikenella sp.]
MGSHGSVYSSAVDDSHSVYLYFHSTTLDPSGMGNRAYGRLLRCLSE